MEKLNLQRKDVLSWDEYFMALACLSALRSKDPSTQIGACIVNSDNRVLSLGYNGTPEGFHDTEFPWGREGEVTKYAHVVHAEVNAIMNYMGNRNDLKGSTIYLNFFPCNECAKVIAQAGIKEIKYLNVHFSGNDYSYEATNRIFEACGIKTTKLDLKDKTITINFL